MELSWVRGGGSPRADGVAEGAVPASQEGRRRLVWLVQNPYGQGKLLFTKPNIKMCSFGTNETVFGLISS